MGVAVNPLKSPALPAAAGAAAEAGAVAPPAAVPAPIVPKIAPPAGAMVEGAVLAVVVVPGVPKPANGVCCCGVAVRVGGTAAVCWLGVIVDAAGVPVEVPKPGKKPPPLGAGVVLLV